MNRVVQTLVVGHQQRWPFLQRTLALVQRKLCRRLVSTVLSSNPTVPQARCHAACLSNQTAAHHSLDLLAVPTQDDTGTV